MVPGCNYQVQQFNLCKWDGSKAVRYVTTQAREGGVLGMKQLLPKPAARMLMVQNGICWAFQQTSKLSKQLVGISCACRLDRLGKSPNLPTSNLLHKWTPPGQFDRRSHSNKAFGLHSPALTLVRHVSGNSTLQITKQQANYPDHSGDERTAGWMTET